MKNVLILGASGNIAKHVIDILVKKDDIHLTLFLRNKSRLRNKDVSKCRIVEGNVLDFQQLKEAITRQDIVYANLSGDLEAMARNIVKAMEETGVKKLIFISSRGVQKMEIKRSGSQPSGKGPAEYFTGTVRIDPLFEAPEPARVRGASVTFEPGARTAWHTHPLGQTLIVTAGCGRVQRWGGPIEEIHPGDVIWFEPGEKHWHGAAPTTAMTHIAIQEHLDGKAVDWMEKVSDEQYQA